MPYTVAISFDKFLEKISLTSSHLSTAKTRRDRIVELLEDGFTVLDAFATGSIVRGTALKNRSDLDVFVVLHYGKHIKGKSPKEVLQDVRDQLSEYDARIVKKNGQAVTLYFKTWPNVDIVPASRVTDNGQLLHYEIPDMNRGEWIKTKPRLHDSNIKNLSVSDRQLLRMVKTWNQVHSSYMQSYHLEVFALKAPSASAGEWPWSVYQFFEHAKNGFRFLSHEGADVDDYLDADGKAEVEKRLSRAAELSRNAWHAVYGSNSNDEEAIRLYRIIFGNNFPAYG